MPDNISQNYSLLAKKYGETWSENPDDSPGGDVHRVDRGLVGHRSNRARSDGQPRIPIHDKNHKTGDHYRQCRVAFRLWPFLSQCQSSERTHYRGCPHHAVSLVRAHYVGVCKQRQLDRRFPTFLGARLCRSTDFFASCSCQVCCPSSARHSNC
jgi:hypothetical protein